MNIRNKNMGSVVQLHQIDLSRYTVQTHNDVLIADKKDKEDIL